MAGFVPSTRVADRGHLRAQVARAAAGASPREQLEHLMGDVAAEILLLEVDIRRLERALLAPAGPRIQLRDLQAVIERKAELDDDLEDLRQLAGEIRSHLTAAA